jgi:glyoxalase family protein
MEPRIAGLHHVTAIAGAPQPNVDFYVGMLGLRLVKRTVNFDDPGTYHLYYGDELGNPGSAMTFFPWPGAPNGRRGAGQVTVAAFSISPDSLPFWKRRLEEHGVEAHGPIEMFGERVLAFEAPDGLALELTAHKDAVRRQGWGLGSVPAEHAIRGFHGVTVAVQAPERTVSLLTGTLGFRATGEEGTRSRFETGEGGPGAILDVVGDPSMPRGIVSVGTVHHVAWRAADDEEQAAWSLAVGRAGLEVTPVRDRRYFRSIYFREPGGVLFEIATDRPGFTLDEPAEALGAELVLPPWLEGRRAELLRSLPALRLPGDAAKRGRG